MKRRTFFWAAMSTMFLAASAIVWNAAGPAAAASDDSVVEGFKTVAIASVSDAVDQVAGARGFMNHDMRPVIPGRVAGRAVTALVKLKTPTSTTGAVDHSVAMIDGANPGEVGVIVMEDGLNTAAIGGLMMTAAKAREMGGMIMDGAARDIPEIRRLGVPVYSRSISPATAVGRYASVSKNEPVTCAGVEVAPGDIIVADEDGVVVVPKEHAEKVLEVAREIDQREGAMVPLIEQMKKLGEAVKKFNRI